MAGSKRIPKWVKVVVAIGLTIGLLFYGAGGIVFANMIHDDALIPLPPTPDDGVYVLAVGEETIELTSATERQDTKRPGLAGLDWGTGYGELGEIISTDGLEVSREFRLVEGQPPEVCVGPIDSCDEVDIEGWAYHHDPSDLGLDFEEVIFPAPIGDLKAWRVDSGDGSIWAIHTHGWRAGRREALRSLPIYHQSGITSLVFDYRNDEGAPTDPSGLYRFGRTEWEDLEAAVRYALRNGAERVILVGYSTGAAIDLAFLEDSTLADRVDRAVFDSPNIDMAETVRAEASKRTIPGTPIPVPGSLTAMAMLIADWRWDIGWDEIDYVDRAETLAVPVLVFHGTSDDRVPVGVARRFRDSSPDLVHLVEMPEAGHVTSWNVDPERYETELSQFLEEVSNRA